jgi:hypothetical protein
MVRAVMTLTKENEISASQMGDKTLAIDKSAGGNLPNTPGKRMISTKRRFP